MDLNEALKGRQSIRKFKSKKPDWRDILECLDASRYAPMAGNNYSVKFILVDDEEKIKEIKDACQQDFVGSVSYIVVACSNPTRTVNAYGKQGEAYVRQQAGAAIQNFLLSVEAHGLGTCWVGYFIESQIKRALEIPPYIQVEAVFPIGFQYEKKITRRAKIDLDKILYFNEWENTRMKPLKKMNV